MGLVNIFDVNTINLLGLDKSSNKVFVLIMNMDKYAQNIPQFCAYLSAKEKEQAKRYYTKLLTDRYILSHGMLRHILSYYAKVLPQELEFIYNEYGKPFLKKTNIQFNMSHSHNIVCYVIALNHKVGIDIELCDHNLNVQELANLVLTPTEYEYLSSLKSKEKHKFFYQLWTKKEALIKANGQGLSYPITTIEAMTIPSGKKILLTNKKDELQQE
jgi:4'-phosphopantetheinyl transferase